jgi:putative aldouronate transport system permease protein
MVENRQYFINFMIGSLLILACLFTIIPFVHELSVSLSPPDQVHKAHLMLWPKQITFMAYKYVFSTSVLVRSLGITVFITVVGTALNLLLTFSAAFVLSKRDLPGANGIMITIIFVMMFSAGIIPNFIILKNYHLLNTVWVMIFPGAVSGFNLILIRNYIMSLPPSLEESARIDGGNDWQILVHVVLPLSMPVISTIGLFYGVAHWNELFAGIFYLTDSKLWPLQVLLRTIIFDSNMSSMASLNSIASGGVKVEKINIQAANIMVATIPILFVYPFLQRHFVKGIILGAVKG